MSDGNKSYFRYISDLLNLPWGMGMIDFVADNYKDNQANFHTMYMLNRTQQIFEYEGLPETISGRLLELLLQTCGNICITKVEGDLYAMWGGLGGEPDPYYQPTIFTVSNPALNYSANLKIGTECVWARNDSLGVGLMPLNSLYSSLLVEGGLSLRLGLINSRKTQTISAEDDKTYKSAEKYLDDVEKGKNGVISSSPFFEGLNIANAPNSREKLTDIIESIQYIKASWFNDLGLNANYNMKRERIQNAEAENDNDALLPLIDNMLKCRVEMCNEVNTLYGTNISVKLSSSWEDVHNDTNTDSTDSTDNADVETTTDIVGNTNDTDIADNKSDSDVDTVTDNTGNTDNTDNTDDENVSANVDSADNVDDENNTGDTVVIDIDINTGGNGDEDTTT